MFFSILLFGKTPYNEITSSRDVEVKKLWSIAKTSFDYSLSTLKESPIELYFIGSDSYNILKYAFSQKKYLLVDELLEIYLKTLKYIKKRKRYTVYEFSDKEEKTTFSLKKEIFIWTNKDNEEELISSSQFLFVVSFAFYEISSIPKVKQTKTMKKFIKLFTPILLNHYKRWVLGVESNTSKVIGSFSRRGWGCKDNKENYIYARVLPQYIKEITNKEYHGSTYCNVIADPSLLIITGLGYFIYSDIEAKTHRTKLEQAYLKSINNIVTLFKHTQIKKDIPILTFQEGAWYGHPDFQYSAYLGSTFPTSKDINCSKDIGIDVAHGSRVIYLLEMLYTTRNKLQTTFPTKEDMRYFSNNFYYRVFNQDFNKPLFKNYLNGSNGWFRVNYDRRDGYGYSPFMLGASGALLGGYPRLARYNPKISKIFISIFKKLHYKIDQDFIHENYEKAIWEDKKKKAIYNFYTLTSDKRSALFLINFYSSLI